VPGTNFGGALTQSQQRDPSMKGVMTRLRTATPKPGLTAPTSDAAPKSTSTATAPAPAKQTFSQAFAAARKAAGGAGGKFSYGGKEYQTNIKGEKFAPAKSLTPVKAAAPASTSAPAPAPAAPKAEPAPTPAPAMQNPDQNITKAPVSQSAPEKAGISQAPTGIKTDFAKAATGTDTSRSLPASSAGSVSVNPEVSKAPENKKVKEAGASTMAESYVAVGANKYRIV
jgi:hypothetical protein